MLRKKNRRNGWRAALCLTAFMLGGGAAPQLAAQQSAEGSAEAAALTEDAAASDAPLSDAASGNAENDVSSGNEAPQAGGGGFFDHAALLFELSAGLSLLGDGGSIASHPDLFYQAGIPAGGATRAAQEGWMAGGGVYACWRFFPALALAAGVGARYETNTLNYRAERSGVEYSARYRFETVSLRFPLGIQGQWRRALLGAGVSLTVHVYQRIRVHGERRLTASPLAGIQAVDGIYAFEQPLFAGFFIDVGGAFGPIRVLARFERAVSPSGKPLRSNNPIERELYETNFAVVIQYALAKKAR